MKIRRTTKGTHQQRFIVTRLVRDIRTGLVLEREGYWHDGPVAKAHDGIIIGTNAWRVYDSSGTAVAAQDADPVTLAADTAYQVRFQIDNTSGDTAANNYTFQLEYNNTTQATGWLPVTTSSSHVRATTSGLSDGTATSNVLTGGSASFVAGEECTDGLSAAISVGSTTQTEVIYGITLQGADVANSDNIELRVTNAGTVLDYDSTNASITASEPTSYTYTVSGGMQTGGNGDWNRAKVYTSLSGGITTGGAATTSKESAFNSYVAPTPTGGYATGGAAVTDRDSTFTYAASGGITTGGAATEIIEIIYPAAGGAVLGGSATYADQYFYSFAPSGGIVLGGAGTTDQEWFYTYAVSGGLQTGGAALTDRDKTFTYLPTGGYGSGGTGDWQIEIIYPATGGITTGGAAVTVGVKNFVYTDVSGGYILAGGDSFLFEVVYPAAQNGYTTGGAAVTDRYTDWPAYAPTGGMTFGGAAATDVDWVYDWNAIGGFTTGGSAATVKEQSYKPVGGIQTGGEATRQHDASWFATGGLLAAGIAGVVLSVTIATSGGMSTGGAATTLLATEYSYQPSGGIQTGGAGDWARGWGQLSPTGGFITSGDALIIKSLGYNGSGGIQLAGAGVTQLSNTILDIKAQLNDIEAKIDNLSTVISTLLNPIEAKCDDLWKVHGLDPSNLMTVTPTSRSAGTLTQEITGDGTTNTQVRRVT